MPAMKFIVSVSVAILAVHLQCVEGQATAACRLPITYNTITNAGTNVYNTLGSAAATCDTTCTASGQTCAGDTPGDATTCVDLDDSLCAVLSGGGAATVGQANLVELGNEICPSITTTAATAQATAGAAPASFPNPVYSADANMGLNTAVIGLTGGTAWTCATAAPANNSPICACRTNTAAQLDTLALCTCTHFGVPTGAPTAIPTTAPTTATSAPTGSSDWSFTYSDDSLSGGAIAGIVIGSVVGAALVIGAGVMIGSSK